MGLIVGKLEFDRCRSNENRQLRLMRRHDVGAKVVMVIAIGATCAKRAKRALARLAVAGRLMLMFVMAQMLRSPAIFVLAIASYRCPRHLER